MADFQTGAELEISVSQSSLSDARDTIESELGDIEVDVNAVVSGGSQPRDPSSGQFLGIEGVEQRVVNTNDTLDGLVQIENERWELDKYRNDYLEEIRDNINRQNGGDGGRAKTLGAAGGAIGGTILGTLAAAGTMFGAKSLTTKAGGLFKGGPGSRWGGGSSTQQLAGLFTGLPGLFAAQSARRSQTRPRGEQNWLEKQFGDAFSNLQIGGGTPAAMIQAPGALQMGMDLADQEWPPLPDLTQNFEWPEPPDFGNLFGGGGRGGQQRFDTGRLTRGRGSMETGPSVEPTINLGGITVDVTTTIDDAVDDAVTDVEDTVNREVGELERRVADAIGGFF